MISPDNIFLYYWGMKASQAHYHGATPAFSVFTLLLLAHFLFPKTWWPNSTARTEFGCPVLHTRLSLTETCVSDKPGQKPPVGRATKHILPVGVFLKLAISPSDSLIETLHRDAAESTCCSKHRRTQSPWGPDASISPTSGTTPSLALELPDCCLSAHEPEWPQGDQSPIYMLLLAQNPVFCPASLQEKSPSQECGIQHTTGQENIVSTRSGHMEEGATVSIHTQAASVANLVPSAA